MLLAIHAAVHTLILLRTTTCSCTLHHACAASELCGLQPDLWATRARSRRHAGSHPPSLALWIHRSGVGGSPFYTGFRGKSALRKDATGPKSR